MKAIFMKELRYFFTTMSAYIFIVFYLAVSALLFIGPTLTFSQLANLGGYFAYLVLFLVLFVPILTMRTIAEERKNGTYHLLASAPVSSAEIVLGKYFACVSVFSIALLLSFACPLILSHFASVYWLSIFVQYLGFFLTGCAFIAIGIFFSAITENQIIAAISSFGFLFMIFMANMIKGIFVGTVFIHVIDLFAITERFAVFLDCLLDPCAVVYLISICFSFIFLTVRSLDKRSNL